MGLTAAHAEKEGNVYEGIRCHRNLRREEALTDMRPGRSKKAPTDINEAIAHRLCHKVRSQYYEGDQR